MINVGASAAAAPVRKMWIVQINQNEYYENQNYVTTN